MAPLTHVAGSADVSATVVELIAAIRMSAWIFAIDDVFDEDLCDPEELATRTVHYVRLAAGLDRVREGDPLSLPLLEVRLGLEAMPLFQPLRRAWLDALRRTLHGMWREWRWRQAWRPGQDSPLPDLQTYVRNGRWSIGAPAHFLATWITSDDASIVTHLSALRGMERGASEAIRLANDLRTYEKEAGEGNINALVLREVARRQRGQGRADALTGAREDVEAMLLRRLASPPVRVTDTGHAERVTLGFMRGVTGFYRRSDFHIVGGG